MWMTLSLIIIILQHIYWCEKNIIYIHMYIHVDLNCVSVITDLYMTVVLYALVLHTALCEREFDMLLRLNYIDIFTSVFN